MSIQKKKLGSFNEAKNIFIKYNGDFEQVKEAYIKNGNVWEQVYAYSPISSSGTQVSIGCVFEHEDYSFITSKSSGHLLIDNINGDNISVNTDNILPITLKNYELKNTYISQFSQDYGNIDDFKVSGIISPRKINYELDLAYSGIEQMDDQNLYYYSAGLPDPYVVYNYNNHIFVFFQNQTFNNQFTLISIDNTTSNYNIHPTKIYEYNNFVFFRTQNELDFPVTNIDIIGSFGTYTIPDSVQHKSFITKNDGSINFTHEELFMSTEHGIYNYPNSNLKRFNIDNSGNITQLFSFSIAGSYTIIDSPNYLYIINHTSIDSNTTYNGVSRIIKSSNTLDTGYTPTIPFNLNYSDYIVTDDRLILKNTMAEKWYIICSDINSFNEISYVDDVIVTDNNIFAFSNSHTLNQFSFRGELQYTYTDTLAIQRINIVSDILKYETTTSIIFININTGNILNQINSVYIADVGAKFNDNVYYFYKNDYLNKCNISGGDIIQSTIGSTVNIYNVFNTFHCFDNYIFTPTEIYDINFNKLSDIEQNNIIIGKYNSNIMYNPDVEFIYDGVYYFSNSDLYGLNLQTGRFYKDNNYHDRLLSIIGIPIKFENNVITKKYNNHIINFNIVTEQFTYQFYNDFATINIPGNNSYKLGTSNYYLFAEYTLNNPTSWLAVTINPYKSKSTTRPYFYSNLSNSSIYYDTNNNLLISDSKILNLTTSTTHDISGINYYQIINNDGDISHIKEYRYCNNNIMANILDRYFYIINLNTNNSTPYTFKSVVNNSPFIPGIAYNSTDNIIYIGDYAVYITDDSIDNQIYVNGDLIYTLPMSESVLSYDINFSIHGIRNNLLYLCNPAYLNILDISRLNSGYINIIFTKNLNPSLLSPPYDYSNDYNYLGIFKPSNISIQS